MLPTAEAPPLDTIEHQIFWMLVKKAARRDDVARVYLALQSALAHRQGTVNVAWLVGALMPDGQTSSQAGGEAIGASGLAYFHWLYDTELQTAGETDRHQYRFVRRADGAQIIADLRTAPAPKSLQFQQEYERQRRRLVEKRNVFLASFRQGRPATLSV